MCVKHNSFTDTEIRYCCRAQRNTRVLDQVQQIGTQTALNGECSQILTKELIQHIYTFIFISTALTSSDGNYVSFPAEESLCSSYVVDISALFFPEWKII